MQNVPIYFASTHGEYDLDGMNGDKWVWDKNAMKIESNDIPIDTFIVPENSFVIEAADIGEITLNYIDDVLWKVLQGKYRQYFVSYLTGNPPVKAINHPYHKKMIKLLRNITIYYPGDTVVSRNLILNSGIDTNLKEGPRIERIRFRGMGFYKFNPDIKEEFPNPDKKISSLPNRYAQVPVSRKGGRIFEEIREDMINGTHITNREFIRNVRINFPESINGGMYVFSSCAIISSPQLKKHILTRSTSKNMEELEKIVRKIQEIQELSRLKKMEIIGELPEYTYNNSNKSNNDEPYTEIEKSQENIVMRYEGGTQRKKKANAKAKAKAKRKTRKT